MKYIEIYKELKSKVEKDYNKCKKFEINCFSCQAYLMLSILADIVEDEQL